MRIAQISRLVRCKPPNELFVRVEWLILALNEFEDQLVGARPALRPRGRLRMAEVADVLSGFNDGIFPFAMGQSPEPSDEQVSRLMEDAEDAFEQALNQAGRTERQEGDAEHILASLLNSWRCVQRARTAAGY